MPRNEEDVRADKVIDPEGVKFLWQKIDRRMKRATKDDEVAGQPDYLVSDPEQAPLMMPDDKFNILGNLTSKTISNIFDSTTDDKEKSLRLARYKKLENSMNNPEAEGILNIYADEATTEDSDGKILHVMHPNQEIVEVLESLFKRVGIQEKAWEMIYNMCGYGDEMYEVVPNQAGTSILQLTWIPRERIERIERNGVLQGFKVIDTLDDTSNYSVIVRKPKDEEEQMIIYPWRILHFKIPSSKYDPYGKAVIDSITGTMDQLNLLIKSMLIARVTRAPERRIYNVDVGNLQGEKAIKYAHTAVQGIKKKKTLALFSSGSTNRVEMVKDLFGATEDIVLPKRTGSEGNSIDTLQQIAMVNVDDAEFIKDRIFPPVGIPRQYLYDDTFANANSNLSSKNVPFSKRIKRVQRYFLKQMYKLATIELKLKKYSNSDIEDLTLLMNNPSTLDEKERIEIDTAMWTLISTIKALNAEKVFYPDFLIYREYMKMSNEEIVELLTLSQLEQQGMNVFNAIPEDERPEGAEDLASAQQQTPTEPGAEEGGEELPGGSGIPPEVEGALGAPPAETGGGAAPTPEVAEFIPGEEKEEAFLEVESQMNKTITEALKKKEKFLEIYNERKRKSISENNQEVITEARKAKGRKTDLSYLDASGNLNGLQKWMEKKKVETQRMYTEDKKKK